MSDAARARAAPRSRRPRCDACPGGRCCAPGMGPARARIAAARGLAVDDAAAVAIAGVCAAVSPELAPATSSARPSCDATARARSPSPGAQRSRAALRAARLARARRARSSRREPTHRARTSARRSRRRRARGRHGVGLARRRPPAAGRSPCMRVVVETAGRELADPRTRRRRLARSSTSRRACARARRVGRRRRRSRDPPSSLVRCADSALR